MDISRGFTLVELLVTVVLAVVLLTIGIPGMKEFFANSRLTTQSNQLVQALNFARSQAISSATDVRLRACTRGGTTSWDRGWVIFRSATTAGGEAIDCNDPTATVTTADTFRIQNATEGTTIIGKDGADADVLEFEFNAQGFPSNATQAALEITDTGSSFTKAICISAQGRPAVRAKGSTVSTCLGGGG